MINYTALNNLLNEYMIYGVKVNSHKITEEDINRLNDDLNVYINEVEDDQDLDDLDETLSDHKSLIKHYHKHVLNQSDTKNRKNRFKYDPMSKQDYINYAYKVSQLTPSHIIDTTISDSGDIDDISDDFVLNGSVLKIDYSLKNNRDHHPMFVIFNKHSNYSKYIDLCLVDKTNNEPITIFAIDLTRYYKHIIKFTST